MTFKAASRAIAVVRSWVDEGHGVAFHLLGLAIVMLTHCLTLTLSPKISQDEPQIVDWGRATWFEPNTQWSLNMLPNGQSVPMLSFLGPTLQEVAYRLTSPEWFGPRLSTILGAALATILVYLWLIRRGQSRFEALCLAALFLLEPTLTSSFRGGRVDAWAMACVFGAMALIRDGRKPPARTVAAGVLLVLGAFVWPTAVLLYPLALAELWSNVHEDFPTPTIGGLTRALVQVAAGSVLAAILLLAALHWVNPAVASLTSLMIGGQFWEEGQTIGEKLIAVWRGIWMSPVTWLMATALAIRVRNRAVLVASLLAYTVVLSTLVYSCRVLYLLPYVIAIWAELLSASRARAQQRLMDAVLVACLVWSFAISVGLRNALALAQARERDATRLREVGERIIGRGPKRVFLASCDFYFVGRQLGWHMKRDYTMRRLSSWKLEDEVDFAVVDHAETQAALIAGGMRIIDTVPVVSAYPSKLTRLIGAKRYGGYVFLGFPRENAAQ